MVKSVFRNAGSISKTTLANIMSRMPVNYDVLHEPCGGTFTLSLNTPHKTRTAFDTNNHIVNAHNVVRNNPDKLIAELVKLDNSYSALANMESKRDFYLDIRSRLNSPSVKSLSPEKQAALFITQSLLCFNGLLRTNSHGHFNVPFGQKEKAVLCDKSTVLAAHAVMASLSITQGDYDEVIHVARANDFVFLHPRPISGKKAAEAGISKLLSVFTTLDSMSVKVMLVISNDENIRSLFSEYTIESISTRSCISASADGRGTRSMLIITNYFVSPSSGSVNNSLDIPTAQ